MDSEDCMAEIDTNGRKTERSTVLQYKIKILVQWLGKLVRIKNVPSNVCSRLDDSISFQTCNPVERIAVEAEIVYLNGTLFRTGVENAARLIHCHLNDGILLCESRAHK